MKHTRRRRTVSARLAWRRSKQNVQTEEKYRNATGERQPIVGGSLAELERRLAEIK